MTDRADRVHYRIRYPRRARPILVTEGAVATVIDCSEFGLSYEAPVGAPVTVPGDPFHGVIRFLDGDEARVEGEVLRVIGRRRVIHLVGVSIPFGIILSEQRYLKRRFAGWG